MSDDPEILAALVELRLGFPDATPGDAAPALEDSPESERLVADARSLSDVFVRLREESTLPPASEEAQRRFLETVKKNPPPPPSVGLSDLVDLFEGRLTDGEAGSIERRLASDSHAQAAMPEAAKLAGILGWMRGASDAGAQAKSSDALRRLMNRVSVELDGELAAAASEPVRPASTSIFEYTFIEPFRPQNGQRWLVTKLVLGVAVVAAAACFALGLTSATPRSSLLAEAAQAPSSDALTELAPKLDALVGVALLEINTFSAEDLADVHLLSRLAVTAPSDEALATAKFLAARRGRVFTLLGQRQDRRRFAPGLPWENVALAETAEALQPTVQEQLQTAVEKRDFQQVEAFCAGRDDLSGRLLEVWAAIGAGRVDEAQKKLAALEAPGEPKLSEAAKVYVAGAYRDIGRPREALSKFKSLIENLPVLAFHVGALYKFDLLDESEAHVWFARLSGGLSSYADFGKTLTRVTPLWNDDFKTNRWSRSSVDPSSTIQARAAREGSLQFLQWQSRADELHAGSLIAGEATWADYQITVGVRLRDPGSFGRRPGVRLFAGWSANDDHYHAQLNRDGLAIGRSEPQGLAAQTVSWRSQGDLATAPSAANPLEPGRWYTLKLRFQRSGPGVVLAAKVWPRDAAEPAGWAIVVTDHSPSAVNHGHIGLSAIDCQADFADLRVESIVSTTR